MVEKHSVTNSTAQPLINRLIVVGLGLIGGSLAAGLRQAQACNKVIGIVRRQQTADCALENDVIDRAFFSLADMLDSFIQNNEEPLGEGDVIFIAVPTLSVEQTFSDIKDLIPATVTITDGASVKGSVVKAAQKIFGDVPAQFVPGHPIAGSEQSGVQAAKADLYCDHRVIITPLPITDTKHIELVTAMWETVNAEVLSMSVEEHDEVLAATSHLPHAIAYSLVDTLEHDLQNENIFRYAAGGFRDFTRIASSDPKMWHDIMRANRQAVLDSIDLFQANLNRMRHAIECDDSEYLLTTFARAKTARDHYIASLPKPHSSLNSNANPLNSNPLNPKK